jgi:UDPglucose 6-dehydrogenase
METKENTDGKHVKYGKFHPSHAHSGGPTSENNSLWGALAGSEDWKLAMEKKKHLVARNIGIGIVGYGYVGRATGLLGCENVKVLIHDVREVKEEDFSGTNTMYCPDISELKNANLIFVSVPTPMEKDGRCHTEIVEGVIQKLKDNVGDTPIIVRSTVPVGFCKKNGVNFMPEFLTERNWINDTRETKDWVVGTYDPNNVDFKEKVKLLFRLAFKNNRLLNPPTVHFTPSDAAEMCKDMKNCFLATKVAFFNELEEFCRAKGVSYDLVRELVCLDDRITDSHTVVPGPDGKRGFGGTCFPKDMTALLYQMSEAEVTSYIIEAAIRRNSEVDRPEEDWKEDKGRAVI